MSLPEPTGVDASTVDVSRTVEGSGETVRPRPGSPRVADASGAVDPAPSTVTAPTPALGVLSRPYLALSLGVVSVILVIAFEATAVGTAMPVVARELHGVSLYAFAFSGFFTTSLFGMVYAGQWADRRGPLVPLGVGIGGFAAGLVVAGTAGTMWVFVLGRAVQGLGAGLVIVSLYVVVGRAYPERLRPAIMAGFAAGWVVPSIVGPLISGTVTEQLGWRWVFLGIPVLVVLPLALALPQIRRRAAGPVEEDGAAGGGPAEKASSEEGTVDKADKGERAQTAAKASTGKRALNEAAAAADGTGTAAHGVTPDAPTPDAPTPNADKADQQAPGAGRRAGRGGDRRRIRLALAVSSGAGLLQYAAQDLRWSSVPPLVVGAALLVPAVLGLLPRGTYRAARGLPSVVLLRGIAAGSFTAAESFVPLMLVTQRGLSPTLAGLSLAVGGASWYFGSFLQSRPRSEPHRERLMKVGMILVAVAIAVVPTVLLDAVPVWIVAVAWAFGCFGMGLVISSTSVLLLRLSPPREAGANSAALQISDGLSNVLLLAVGGAAFAALGGGSVAGPGAAADRAGAAASAATGSHPAAFLVVFLPMAAVAVVGAWVTTRLRERQEM